MGGTLGGSTTNGAFGARSIGGGIGSSGGGSQFGSGGLQNAFNNLQGIGTGTGRFGLQQFVGGPAGNFIGAGGNLQQNGA